jgi:hypothetical protein
MLVQKFTGSIEARVLNPINNNNNLRIHRIDLRKALNFTATLTNDDPEAFLDFFVYTKESRYNNLNSELFTTITGDSINNVIESNGQRDNRFGQGQLQIIFTNDIFDPNEYIFTVTLLQSSKTVNYTLTITYEEGKECFDKSNPFLGFWALSDRNTNRQSFEIKTRSDGSVFKKYILAINKLDLLFFQLQHLL